MGEVLNQPLVDVSTRPIETPAHGRTVRRSKPYIAAAVGVIVVALVAIRLWPQLFPAASAQVLKASGRIEGREITLAPKDIQGRVKRLLVDEGQTVVAGQLLAELDAAQLDARYEIIQGNLGALDAQIAQAALDVEYTLKSDQVSIAAADAAVSGAKARVDRAKAVNDNAAAEYTRLVTLRRDDIVTQQSVDQALMAQRTSEADVDAAQKDLVRADAGLALARTSADAIGLKRQQVRALQAARRGVLGQLAEANANLAERRIVAPANGTILSRPVEVGDVVAPGSAVFQMVDMSRLYLKVYIPEPDVGKLRLGDAADVSVDALPHKIFVARVSKISDQAEFTPKNVETAEERLKLVFGVELGFVDSDGRLKPGMPADCVIHWRPDKAESAGHGH
jgi:HlyD family secretion protein